MITFTPVASADDPRVHLYGGLRDMQLRQSLEAEHGIFMAEGEKVIERALAAGHEPLSFLLSPRWQDHLTHMLETTDAPVYVMPEDEITAVTGFHVHRGALAAFRRPAPRSVEELLSSSQRIVVLEDLADHTNIGAIFRTVAALGWDGIVLSPRCADPWYRRSLKVSMGAVLTLPFAVVEDWYGLPALMANHGHQSLAMTLADDAVPLDAVEAADRVALVVGAEGHGISDHWQQSVTTRVTIPMREGIDSLNVAASVAIACWQLAPARS